MILYEYEGKEILVKNGVVVPKSQLITQIDQEIKLTPPYFLKAQVLSGKRKAAGGIVLIKKKEDLKNEVVSLFSHKINGEKVDKILVEKKIDFTNEYYLSISYDSDRRSPIITYSSAGGTGIEDRKVNIIPFNILSSEFNKKDLPKNIVAVLPKLINLFLEQEMFLLEINPLVEDKKGSLVALDAKIKLDDSAFGRHNDWNFEPRSVAGHKPTKNEIQAKLIDENDYRGTAGSTYFDLDGDIAVLASGGGASLTAMDVLIASGAKPANYTEYSGNPPRQKVEKLTKIVLSKKNLHALWVIGAIANFTDIYETLSGFIEALKKVKPRPKFPILIRRGGPNDKKAFEMLKNIKDFDLHLYGEEISITESAKIVADLAKKYVAATK